MIYHTQLILQGKNPEYVYNYTIDELKDKIIKPYEEGTDLFVNGSTVRIDIIERIVIRYTEFSIEETAQKMSDTIQREIEMKAYLGFGTTRRSKVRLDQAFEKGKNVTREFIQGPPGFSNGKEMNIKTKATVVANPKADLSNFHYAIVTALYKDELKYVEPYIDYIGEIENDEKKLIRYGTLKANSKINILYASLLNTGMVDAAIVTTDIITRFNPRVLFMPGVCGGREKEGLKMLDLIIPNKVFTFQKGKLKDDGFEGESEGIDLNDKILQKIAAAEESISKEISFKGKVHYEPMACSTAVIDKAGVFDIIAMSKDRKVLGMEMEGYGVARACEITNNGNTKAIIIKSVMDNTTSKDDSYKAEAAKISADFVMKLIENEIV